MLFQQKKFGALTKKIPEEHETLKGLFEMKHTKVRDKIKEVRIAFLKLNKASKKMNRITTKRVKKGVNVIQTKINKKIKGVNSLMKPMFSMMNRLLSQDQEKAQALA